jgi:outer membrane protein assembly factor BamE (lipoprotein component of BamABCDE complex)
MKFKYATCLLFCLLMMAISLPGFSGSSKGNADVCDPEIIGRIKQGQSTKADVKQLIGEPGKVEGAMNQGELWKYSYQVTRPTGSGFKTESRDRAGSGMIQTDKKNCNLWVYFEKNGTVRKVQESEISGGSGFMK